MKIYGSDICPQCRDFKSLMAQRGIVADYIDMTESVMNMREFLHMRDHAPEFAPVREKGSIGIPCFVADDGKITLDENTALEWLGQPPMETEEPVCESCK